MDFSNNFFPSICITGLLFTVSDRINADLTIHIVIIAELITVSADKSVLKHHYLHMLCLKLNKLSNFQPRSETQL